MTESAVEQTSPYQMAENNFLAKLHAIRNGGGWGDHALTRYDDIVAGKIKPEDLSAGELHQANLAHLFNVADDFFAVAESGVRKANREWHEVDAPVQQLKDQLASDVKGGQRNIAAILAEALHGVATSAGFVAGDGPAKKHKTYLEFKKNYWDVPRAK